MDKLAKITEIKYILIDVDGILTDGKIYYTHRGEVFKGFCSKDVRAIRELISYGYEVILITASSWPGAAHFAAKTGAEIFTFRNKLKILEYIKHNRFIAVGDDVWDLQLMQLASVAFTTVDADDRLFLSLNDNLVILKTKGGEGVIADMVALMFNGEN